MWIWTRIMRTWMHAHSLVLPDVSLAGAPGNPSLSMGKNHHTCRFLWKSRHAALWRCLLLVLHCIAAVSANHAHGFGKLKVANGARSVSIVTCVQRVSSAAGKERSRHRVRSKELPSGPRRLASSERSSLHGQLPLRRFDILCPEPLAPQEVAQSLVHRLTNKWDF